MSLKRKSNIDDSSEECDLSNSDSIDSSDNDSVNSDFDFPESKRSKKSAIDDDSDDEISVNQLLSEWIWKNENNKPKIWEYMQTPGINVTILNHLNGSNKELDFFNIMFDDEFWDNIVKETNWFAEKQLKNMKQKKLDEKWIPINRDEIKIYFSLCIIMAQVKKPNIQMNWSKKAIIETPIFRNTMPLKRFSEITRFFHFVNDDTVNEIDKLHKVIHYFNKKFKEVYVMEENVTIDESLMKFKGRTYQLNTAKRVRYGIKVYKLCESTSGYCYNFQIHYNDKANDENAVIELTKPILYKGHTLYINDRYSSPELFSTLIEFGTNVIGTVHLNKKNMPRDFIETKLKKGECLMRSCNGILSLKWKHNHDVHIISTKHESVEMIEQYGSQQIPTFKPKCFVDYNLGIISIDQQDKILACFPVMRKYLKGYRKIFLYLFDMALFNSYILYNKNNIENKQNYAEYRLQIAEGLLQNVPSQDYKRNQSNEEIPMRLHAKHWGHFPKHIDSTPLKKHPTRACKVCTKHKQRSETTWECKKCQVALHVPHCFEKYHTVDDY